MTDSDDQRGVEGLFNPNTMGIGGDGNATALRHFQGGSGQDSTALPKLDSVQPWSWEILRCVGLSSRLPALLFDAGCMAGSRFGGDPVQFAR